MGEVESFHTHLEMGKILILIGVRVWGIFRHMHMGKGKLELKNI